MIFSLLPIVAGAYLGRWLDSHLQVFSVRWTVSLIVLVLLVMLVVWAWPEDGPEVKESTALVIKPSGVLVEQEVGALAVPVVTAEEAEAPEDAGPLESVEVVVVPVVPGAGVVLHGEALLQPGHGIWIAELKCALG